MESLSESANEHGRKAPTWGPPRIPELTFSVSGSPGAQTLALTWPKGNLYSATSLAGPWTLVNTTGYSYSTPISTGTPSMFFTFY